MERGGGGWGKYGTPEMNTNSRYFVNLFCDWTRLHYQSTLHLLFKPIFPLTCPLVQNLLHLSLGCLPDYINIAWEQLSWCDFGMIITTIYKTGQSPVTFRVPSPPYRHWPAPAPAPLGISKVVASCALSEEHSRTGPISEVTVGPWHFPILSFSCVSCFLTRKHISMGWHTKFLLGAWQVLLGSSDGERMIFQVSPSNDCFPSHTTLKIHQFSWACFVGAWEAAMGWGNQYNQNPFPWHVWKHLSAPKGSFTFPCMLQASRGF